MFEDLRNNIDFFIRNKTRFSRKGFVEKNKELLKRNKLENLYTEDVLSRYFSKLNKEKVHLLDIGCKNWFYAKGEADFLMKKYSQFEMDGVEIDAFRLYFNLYSRYEVAKYYTKGLNANYIAGNLLDIDKKYDYITWFLPFVVVEPLIYWGLPKKYFCPEKLLAHAYSLLSQNGEMLIINQASLEAEAQKELLDKLNIPYKELGEVKSEFFEYKNQRFGFLIKKN